MHACNSIQKHFASFYIIILLAEISDHDFDYFHFAGYNAIAGRDIHRYRHDFVSIIKFVHIVSAFENLS